MQDLFSQRGVVRFGTHAQRLVALFFAALLMALGLFSPPACAAGDSIEIRRNLPLLLQTLDSLPYSKEGKGPVIYVIEFSTCAVARRFETEYGAKLAGMGFEVRRIYYGVDVATQNNAAASALSRDPAMQRAFMFENRRAASVYDTPAALAAYQDVPDKLKAVVAVLQLNGWRSDRVVSPMFIYPDGQRMFADSGYGAEQFKNRILSRLQLAATGTTPATPPAPVPTEGGGPLPDVLGFRLGMTVPQVLARVKALKLPHPESGGVVTSSVAGLPNSSHQSFVTAHDVGPNGVFRLSFSAPPGESRLVNVNRGVDYKATAADAASAYATLRAALVQKFGTPTESSGDKKFHERLTWIWDRQGRLLTQSPGTGCTFSMFWESVGPMRPPSANVERQIDRGCAVMVQTDINFNSAGVVERLNQAAVDVDGRERAARITQKAIDDHAKRQGEQQLEKSKQQKPAI
jgi:hypothetical protein